MCGRGTTSPNTVKYHSNTVPQKENDNSPETKLKATEYCDLTDREFKIAVMKKVKELKENSDRQFNELRNEINEQRNTLQKRLKL